MLSSILSIIRKPYIYIPLGISIIGLTTKTLYNSPKSCLYNKPVYNVNIINEYTNTDKRQYKYTVDDPTFEKISNEYKESLFGNHIIKQDIDNALQDYLKTNVITEKYIVINIPAWSALIEITSNNDLKYLIINIYNR